MSFDVSTLATGGVAAVSLLSAAACAAQCFLLKKRIAALESQPVAAADGELPGYHALSQRLSAVQSSVAVLQSGVSEVQSHFMELESRIEARLEEVTRTAAAASDGERRKTRFQTEIHPAVPVNLNRRGQMMRLHRKGESIPAIASALGISQGEVKLTVRMQELFSDLPEKETSHDRL